MEARHGARGGRCACRRYRRGRQVLGEASNGMVRRGSEAVCAAGRLARRVGWRGRGHRGFHARNIVEPRWHRRLALLAVLAVLDVLAAHGHGAGPLLRVVGH